MQAPVQMQSEIVLLPRKHVTKTRSFTIWSLYPQEYNCRTRCTEGMAAKIENREAAKNRPVAQPI
jgi:hypothetical protein